MYLSSYSGKSGHSTQWILCAPNIEYLLNHVLCLVFFSRLHCNYSNHSKSCFIIIASMLNIILVNLLTALLLNLYRVYKQMFIPDIYT